MECLCVIQGHGYDGQYDAQCPLHKDGVMYQHTSGTWEVHRRPDGFTSITTPPMSDGVRITIVPRVFAGRAGKGEQEANIALIANAPETLRQRDRLLEAVKQLLRAAGEDNLNAELAAIANGFAVIGVVEADALEAERETDA